MKPMPRSRRRAAALALSKLLCTTPAEVEDFMRRYAPGLERNQDSPAGEAEVS